MSFLSKVGNILKQTANRKIGNEFSASRPSIYQAIRCMSTSKVFVGGISYQTDDTSLREAFSKYGEVMEARIIVDRETGRSRGFGFVTYTSSEDASSAIQALDGQDLHGRRIRVNYANDRPRGAGGFGGGGYGAGGGGYGSGGYGAGGGGGYGSGGYGAGGGGAYGGGGGYGGGSSNGGYGGGGINGGGSSYGGSGDFGTGGGSYGGSGDFGTGGGSYGGSGDYGGGNAGVSLGNADGVDGTGWDGYVQGGNTGGSGAGNYANPSGANENTSFDAGAGGYDGQQLEGNFQDNDDDDFAKRA